MLRAIEQPLPVSSFLHPRSPALCDDCIMQSLQTAITLAPHHPPRVSWLATPPTGTPSTPTTPARSHFFSLTRRVNPHPPPRPAPCIPAALAPAASSSPYPAGRPNAAKTSHPHLPRRANRPPAPSSSSLHPPCIRCARPQPHPHPHPANSPSLQLPDKSKSRQVGKLASWQVGKHCHLPLHHQPVPAAPLFSLTPPVNQCPPAPRSLTYTLQLSFFAPRSPYPGVNQKLTPGARLLNSPRPLSIPSHPTQYWRPPRNAAKPPTAAPRFLPCARPLPSATQPWHHHAPCTRPPLPYRSSSSHLAPAAGEHPRSAAKTSHRCSTSFSALAVLPRR